MPERRPPTRRRPPRRGVTPERVLGLAGTAALLIVAVAIASMILSDGDDEQEAAVPTPRATPSRTPTPTPTPKPKPKLTAEQRRERREAVAELTRQGYDAVTLRDYKPRNTLRVLRGERPEAAGGGVRAFFFVGDEFVGTDTQDASATLRVSRTTRTTVTLSYGVYETGDLPCCPSGRQRVRFRWEGGSLRSDALPPPPAVRAPRDT